MSTIVIFSRSYCYTVTMIDYWHHPVVRLSVRPSVHPSVTLCIVALRVGVEG